MKYIVVYFKDEKKTKPQFYPVTMIPDDFVVDDDIINFIKINITSIIDRIKCIKETIDVYNYEFKEVFVSNKGLDKTHINKENTKILLDLIDQYKDLI
jgi:hypothetical protein